MKNAKAFIEEFHLKNFAPNLTAGIVIGITAIFFQTSLAALIFSGELSAFLADGIGIILFGGLALAVAVTFLGSLPGTMPSVQDSPAAIFALAAAAIASQMIAVSAPPDQIYITVVACLALTTIVTGALFIIVGRFGLSNFVRFVPYPVVGGFLAGTGWLLVQGALGVMSGLPMHLSDFARLFESGILILWLPGGLFALLLLFVLRRFQHPLLMIGLLLAGVAGRRIGARTVAGSVPLRLFMDAFELILARASGLGCDPDADRQAGFGGGGKHDRAAAERQRARAGYA
jgi:SulP family sulfate permease